MLTQPVLSKENKELKKIELNKEIFGDHISKQLLFNYVQMYLANQRLGTAKAKTRGEVHGTTKKMCKQKGTGGARHGSAKAPIFVGGGVTFPPIPKDWSYQMPQKAKKKALGQAMALRFKEGNMIIVDDIHCDAIKTQKLVAQMKKWGVDRGLVVVEDREEKTWKSLRNVKHMGITTADILNAYDILKYGKLILTEKALHKLEKRLAL